MQILTCYPSDAWRCIAACLLACALAGSMPRPALAQSGPQEVVVAHFEAIMAQEYVQADTYFSREFRAAFKADVERINAYYRTRAEQLARGYEIREVSPLDDGDDRETMRVTVDFADADRDDGLEITERIYYYLIRPQNACGEGDLGLVSGETTRTAISCPVGP